MTNSYVRTPIDGKTGFFTCCKFQTLQQHRRRTHSMSTGASLNRLASSSRCLSVAKHPLLAASSGARRSYATEHAAPARPPPAKPAAPPSLAARLHKAVKNKERPRVVLPKLHVPYPNVAVNFRAARKTSTAGGKQPPRPSNAPQKAKGPYKPSKGPAPDKHATQRAAGRKDHVAVVQPTWRPPKVTVLPRAPESTAERSAPRRPAQGEGIKLVPASAYASKAAGKDKELELGPGFAPEDWADKLSACFCWLSCRQLLTYVM